MAENPKPKAKKISDRDEETSPKESAGRSYYYDDAHGYEEYDKDKEEEDDELDD